MAATTPRFGLSWFDTNTEGDFSEDSQKYTGEDRLLLDSVLAALEKHDHHIVSTLDAPTGTPDVQYSLGGALDGGTEYFYVISFITADGLETTTGEEVSVTTPDILAAPDMPSAETGDPDDYPAGHLTEGVYYYAVTGLRSGEESAISDFDVATVLDDETTVIVTLPDLEDATSFQVWRMKETDAQWTRLGTTSDPTYIDDGSIPAALFGDPANTPPEDAEGSDNYLVTIALTGDDLTRVQSGEVAGWRIYRTTISGSYSAASLVHEVVEHTTDTDPDSPLVTSWIDDGDEPFTGSPRTKSTQLQVSPYTFEKASALPATTAYPSNYPILVGDTLYYNKAGTWTPLSGGGSGGSGGGISFDGAWASGTYDPATLVTYNNGLWLSNTSATTTPGSQAGGYPLTLNTNGESYGQSIQPTAYRMEDVGQKFRNDGAMTITSVQLYFDGTQSVGRNLFIGFQTSAQKSSTNYSSVYEGTIPAGTGWKSFPLAAGYSLPANTDVWLRAGGFYSGYSGTDAVVPGMGLCLQGAQTDGMTFTGASYSRTPPGYTELIEDAVNDGGKMLCFRLVGTSAVVNEWDRLASLVPAATSTGQVLTSTGTTPGAYAWGSAPGSGGSGGGFAYRGLETSVVASDPGIQTIFATVPVPPGQTFDFEANLLYSPGYGNVEWYIGANIDTPAAASLGYNTGELWYPAADSDQGTLIKRAAGTGLIGTGDQDGGPALTMTGDGFQSPVTARFLVTNTNTGTVTINVSVALLVLSVIDPGASITIASGSFLRAAQVA